jgi:post-segregation antitoxin (ccd killing protein)
MRRAIPDTVTLQLTSDEALVLDAQVSRFDASGERSTALTIEHSAERAALWALQGALERSVVAALRADYDRLLVEAQERLCEKAGL